MTATADANSELVENIKGASSKVGELSSAYDSAASSVKEITSISAGDSNFGDKIDQVSGNLSELNNVYEMQLKGASAHLKASEEMYSGINELMSNLHSSLEDTRKYKETMSELTTNLASLNTVYGNMLSAMNVNG